MRARYLHRQPSKFNACSLYRRSELVARLTAVDGRDRGPAVSNNIIPLRLKDGAKVFSDDDLRSAHRCALQEAAHACGTDREETETAKVRRLEMELQSRGLLEQGQPATPAPPADSYARLAGGTSSPDGATLLFNAASTIDGHPSMEGEALEELSRAFNTFERQESWKDGVGALVRALLCNRRSKPPGAA